MARPPNPNDPQWPQSDPKRFIESDEFGRILVALATEYARRYPTLDFSDAVAHVFVTLDRRLRDDPAVLNLDRFPRFSAFRAYVRQMIWNAGLLAQRQQSRLKRLEEVADSPATYAEGLSPQRRAEVHEAVERLAEPYRSIIERVELGGEELAEVVDSLGEDPARADELFGEALDRLADELRP